jgi:hypothetical protein
VATLVLVLLAGLSQQVFTTGGATVGEGYESLFQHFIASQPLDALLGMPSTALLYGREAKTLWPSVDSTKGIASILYILSVVPVLVGFWRRVRQGPSILEVFAVLYCAALLPWSFGAFRYLIPVIPLYYLYLIYGTNHLVSHIAVPKRLAYGVVGLLLGVLYLVWYGNQDYGPIESRYTHPEAHALYSYVHEHVPETSLIIVERHLRQFAFFTERRISKVSEDQNLVAFMERYGGGYVLVEQAGVGRMRAKPSYIHVYVQGHPDQFQQVYENDTYILYRLVA